MLKPIRLRRLLRSRQASWNLALLLGALTLFSAIALLATSGWFITASAIAGLALASSFSFDYFRPAALIRLFAIVRTAGRYGERLASHHATLSLLKDLRSQVFRALTLRTTPINQESTGSAATMHRLVADIDRLDRFPLQFLAPWIWASVIVLAYLSFAYWLLPQLAYASAIGLCMAWLLVPCLGFWRGRKLALTDVQAAELRREHFLESLSLLTSLTLWQSWPQQQRDTLSSDEHYQAQELQQQQLISVLSLLQQLALAVSLGALLWVGAPAVSASLISVPWLLAAALALLGIHEALVPLAGSFIGLGQSQAARDRINQLMQLDTLHSASAQQSTDKPRPNTPLQLQAQNLSARIPGALNGPENINIDLSSGDILLITGASGIGKTTLLKVLANTLENTSGNYLINQRPAAQWQLDQCIGYLPQQLDIFDSSLASNLRLADPHATDEQLWQVLADVALADWAKQQSGLETALGEYGAQISGGQARRIALARLLLAKRPILLLDEPFAGLDSASSYQVLAALQRRQAQGLLVIVSHHVLDIPGAQRLHIG
ncbi:thiol reductant ABC exporter subunit CydC [Denitrificimonas caeni]|uniref:Thiol reductant ABC exporter subunit CydC n=1 Tax=Denitrificimonas caeni TaxID=521720 RepID=A0AAE9VNL5_9GAMM|nr:thiol reductant ABC exporter subunit CydC [Denitrificimonas caeni]WBE24573.1 thiol reductant ABC exporter subunit CydC [Denitrificimonas caeni]